MSASTSLVGTLPAASVSHRRLPCFSSLPFSRRRLRSFTSSTSGNVNVVRATASEAPPEDAQKASPSSSAATAAPKRESATGVGFSSGRSGDGGGKGNRKSKVVRRTPVQRPLIQSVTTATQKDDGGVVPEQEKAFLLVWLGLGLLILVEGIALASSGGTVAYGVLKYLKAGQSKN